LKGIFKQRLENLIDGMGEKRNWWVEASIISYFIFFKGLFKQRLEILIDGMKERKDS